MGQMIDMEDTTSGRSIVNDSRSDTPPPLLDSPLEDHFYQVGYAQGLQAGRDQGLEEGRQFGEKWGFTVVEEIAFYTGWAEVWMAHLSQHSEIPRLARCHEHLAQLKRLLPTDLSSPPQPDLDLKACLLEARGLYKKVSSVLGIPVRMRVSGGVDSASQTI